jgi:hypothetical protein
VSKLSSLWDGFVRCSREKIRSLIVAVAVEDPREPVLTTNIGWLSIWSVFIVFSTFFIGLVDRQPSPARESHWNIGPKPGFTLAQPNSLFPWELSPEQIGSFALSVYTATLTVFLLREAFWRGSNSESLVDGVLSSAFMMASYLCVNVGVLLWLFDYYENRGGSPIPVSLNLLISNLNNLYLLVFVLLVQVFTLGAVVILYSRPLLPRAILPDQNGNIQNLDNHMKNSWKLTQLGVSAGVAVAVGISLPTLVGKTGLTLLNMMLTAGFLTTGAFALLLFPVLKVYYADQKRQKAVD